MKTAVSFRLSGRVGHFLRAESGVSALSYPVPSRTVLLGIIGAVLGLDKDQPQQLLEPACLAVRGKAPQTHWHKAKLRKDPPESLPMVVKYTQKQDKTTKPEQATLISQEWLLNPSYEVWAILPDKYHTDFAQRVQERRWYFSPALGLSEMLADIEFLTIDTVQKLAPNVYPVNSVIRQDLGQINFNTINEEDIALQLLQMPRTVTPDRVFTHARYLLETNARPVNIQTGEAYQVGEGVVMFL